MKTIGTKKFMTVAELGKACKNHAYILARCGSGYQIGLNCKVAPIARRIKKVHSTKATDFVSFQPCDFMTYITHKHPFISK